MPVNTYIAILFTFNLTILAYISFGVIFQVHISIQAQGIPITKFVLIPPAFPSCIPYPPPIPSQDAIPVHFTIDLCPQEIKVAFYELCDLFRCLDTLQSYYTNIAYDLQTEIQGWLRMWNSRCNSHVTNDITNY